MRTSGSASTEITAVARIVNTPTERSAIDTSSRTARVSPVAAWLDSRVNIAVSRETVTSECGSMKMVNALLYATLLATSGAWPVTWPAAVVIRVTTRMPTWPAASAANVQPATRPAVLRPARRQSHRGRKRKPIRRSGTTRTSAWATMPIVAVAPRKAIGRGPQAAGSDSGPSRVYRPYTAMNAPKPTIDTTLLTTGAHMYGPKLPRALSTWPSSVYRP